MEYPILKIPPLLLNEKLRIDKPRFTTVEPIEPFYDESLSLLTVLFGDSEKVIARRKQDHQERTKEYVKELYEYYSDKLSHFKSERNYLMFKNIEKNEHLYNKYNLRFKIEKLLKSDPPIETIKNISNGVSEEFFYNNLTSKFENYIYNNLSLKINNSSSYYPDFTFWDKESNFLVDIEIDEPYVGKDGTPIHYKNADDYRDSFFLNSNWIVLRFTEKQVVKNTNECLKLIGDVHSSFLNCIDLNELDFECIPKQQHWTKEEANKLAFKRYRNTYLPSSLQSMIKEEKLKPDDVGFIDDLPF